MWGRERLPTIRTVEVAPLDEKERQLEHARLANLGKFLSTLRRGQRARNFSLAGSTWVGCFTTIQVPISGKMTHEHARRSALSRLYGRGTVAIVSLAGWNMFSTRRPLAVDREAEEALRSHRFWRATRA